MSGAPTPGIVDLCIAGRDAFESDEIELAVQWYELACASTLPGGAYDDPIGHVFAELVDRRFERYQELRQMVPWRSVRRRPTPDPGHVFIVQTVLDDESLSRRRAARSLTSQNSSHDILLIVDETREGQAKTFFRALAVVAARHPDFTALTLLEDDVVLAKNALDYIASYRPDPDLILTSWFSVETCEIPRTRPVLSVIPAPEYMFNQAVTMPASTVHALLASNALKNWPEKHGADRIYGKVFPKGKCALHFPSIVQHVGGAESLVGNNDHGLRTSPTFIGEGADALELVRG